MRNSTQNILRGIQIILKYQFDAIFTCEHDILCFGGYYEDEDTDSKELKMSAEDAQLMNELGWGEDEGRWSYYV